VHAVSGVLLLGGIILYFMQTGSVAFDQIEVGGPAFWLILIGFMVNAAVPPLHAWLTDAYPEATITGAIFLSAFTTKTAVYTLIRGYPGVDFLVWLGAIMALWGVVYAVLANDIRRLLAYHIISQVGYMVAGVGMGTAIALNGAASHAFTHILYKSLLFMGAGAVIYMTGRSKLTELGGIYRWMPITFLLYMVGAFSISAFPLFSGFVSKTMVVEAAAVDGRAIIWLMLSMASAGTFLHTGLKLPWFTFMGKDSGLRPREAPWNMLFAMGIAAFFCIFIGVNPQWLYQFLPGPVDYNAYTSGHVLWELQLLLFTGLGFFLLLKHVGGEAKTSVDTDWVYRVAFPRAVRFVGRHGTVAWHAFLGTLLWPLERIYSAASRHHGPQGTLAKTWPTGSMVLWVAVLLAASLLIYYL
jgi:multicomponent Na+:H+ antiporter subunit D